MFEQPQFNDEDLEKIRNTPPGVVHDEGQMSFINVYLPSKEFPTSNNRSIKYK